MSGGLDSALDVQQRRCPGQRSQLDVGVYIVHGDIAVPGNQTRLRVSLSPNNNALCSPRNFVNELIHDVMRRLREGEMAQLIHFSTLHGNRRKRLLRWK